MMSKRRPHDQFPSSYLPNSSVVVAAAVAGFILLLYFLWKRSSTQKPSHNTLLRNYHVDHPERIVDQFSSVAEVSKALKAAGLESSNLIFGIDYTASNEDNGARTFGGKSLHHLSPDAVNPYQNVISVLGRTLQPFDDDDLIPAFGFGDVRTKDKAVFALKEPEVCYGFDEVLSAYNQVTPHVRLCGPTDFTPLIHKAIDIVKSTREYHILVIVADGQVINENRTKRAIEQASNYPLSIIMVGVGDGPWDMMQEFDDGLEARRFDNFQFVNFHSAISMGRNPDVSFALHALMEIPDQFKKIRQLGLLDF